MKVRFREENKQPEYEAKLAIICGCFTTALSEPLGTLQTRPTLKDRDFEVSTWKKRQKESPLTEIVARQINIICTTINTRIRENADPNDPLHLMLFEHLYWLALTLSGESRRPEAITNVNKRIEYINALLKSTLLSPDDVQDLEIRMLLNTLKSHLRKIIPKLKPETPSTQIHSHLENLIFSGRLLIDNSVRFLYMLLSNCELEPFTGCANLQPNDQFITGLSETKSGQLLKSLLIAPQLGELFKDKEPASPTQSPRTPRLKVGLHRVNSIKQLQMTNPYINSENQLRIPKACLNGSPQLPTSLIEFFQGEDGDQIGTGIYSPFLSKPNLITTFTKMHALVFELLKLLLSCKEGLELIEEDHDLLNPQKCNAQLITLMERLNEFSNANQECKNKLLGCVMETWNILSKANITSNPKNAIWLRNITSIIATRREFDSASKMCRDETEAIIAIASAVPENDRKKMSTQIVTQYEYSLESLNQESGHILTNLPKSPDPSPQSTPRSPDGKSPTNSRQSSPTLPRKSKAASPKKEKSRRKQITGSLLRRRQGQCSIAVPAFEIPEPHLMQTNPGSAETSPRAHTIANRPPPPKHSPILAQPDADPQEPSHFGMGSPAMERKKQSTRDLDTPTSQTQQFSLGSPSIVRKNESPDVTPQNPSTPQFGLGSPVMARKRAIDRKPDLENGADGDVESEGSISSSPSQISSEESPKIAHRICLYGIKKPKRNQPLRCLTDADMPNILSEIREDTIRIELQKNNLTGTGIVALCEKLKAHQSICQLNLSCNPDLFKEIPAKKSPTSCQYPAALAIKELLEANISIKELWISECGFSSTICMSFLANGLRRNESLEFLDIGVNGLTDDGAIMLFDALSRHPNMRFLAIDGNELTDKSGERLLALVRSKTQITFLRFDRNKISDKLMLEIQTQVLANWKAQEISSSTNTLK